METYYCMGCGTDSMQITIRCFELEDIKQNTAQGDRRKKPFSFVEEPMLQQHEVPPFCQETDFT